ncbi:MAG: feruloyl-CoA synthase [Polyangiaceae bacterium]
MPRALQLAPPLVSLERLSGGRVRLRSPMPLAPHARSIGDVLEAQAVAAPDRTFLAEPDGEGAIREVSYSQALSAARSIGQALLERGLGPSRPVAILSDNSIEHALLALGAQHAGIPVAPISQAYSLLSRDHAKLRAIVRLVEPGLVFAANGDTFGPAIEAAVPRETPVVVTQRPLAGRASALFSELSSVKPGAALSSAFASLTPDTVAKLLFTSGSTGEPKGVLNTHRMLCSNQQAIAQLWPFLRDRPPVVVDWLPWSHTFGGNHNFYMVLWHGGTLHIDHGKPAPALGGKTVDALRKVSPTLYFNVPRGYDMLLPFLERDAELRESFFRELDLLFYAAAALPAPLWERLEKASIAVRGERVMMASAWGATETSPMVTSVHFPIDRAGVIGLPAPGTDLLMVPVGGDSNTDSGRWELRVRGPNVTPGYYRAEDATRAAFDEEGYYRIGDAGKLLDPEDPSKGVVFDGRIAEDFKLTSGTWVHVGALRGKLLTACAPVVEDAVLTGHDRDEVGVLMFPSLSGCQKLCPDAPPEASVADLVAREEVRARVREGLSALAEGGSSMRVSRALFLLAPPSIDAGEITDKGYIHQRRVRERRAADVEKLHAPAPDKDVLRPLASAEPGGRTP